jgi:hypothetical protein
MIPTRGKSRLPSFLSYPVNAKTVSEALAQVPQLEELSLRFFYYRNTWRENKTQPILSAEYSYQKASQYDPHRFEEFGWYQPRWIIEVHPVPREMRSTIAQLLKGEGLPRIARWLQESTQHTGRQVSSALRIEYNLETNALEYRENFHP